MWVAYKATEENLSNDNPAHAQPIKGLVSRLVYLGKV